MVMGDGLDYFLSYSDLLVYILMLKDKLCILVYKEFIDKNKFFF